LGKPGPNIWARERVIFYKEKSMTVSHATEKLVDDLRTVVRQSETKLRDTGKEITAKARSGIDKSVAAARKSCDEADRQMRLALKRTDAAVRDHPYTALGIGLGLGLLIGALLLRRR
jgi:ElaB/YqjD/DUF883 family membrane-anchored ribosome-binding protein